MKSGDIGRKKLNSRRVEEKYQPNLELCVDNVTEVEIKVEDQDYLRNLLQDLNRTDDELITSPSCRLLDDYPFHLIETTQEMPVSEKKQKRNTTKRMSKIFSRNTPEK